MVTLRQPLTLEEVQLVREWRNDPAVLPMLRTGYKTEDEQAQFYRDVICNPESVHRYYAVIAPNGAFVGMGGLTYLVLGEAEISLILAPESRGCGLGRAAVDALLAEAKRLGVVQVIGECYEQGNVAFWAKQLQRKPGAMLWRWSL